MDYRTLMGEILSGAIRRYKEREARRSNSGEKNAAANGNGSNGHAPAPAPERTESNT